jgi:hypothetical protein
MNAKRSLHLAALELPDHDGPDFFQWQREKFLIIAARSDVIRMNIRLD